MVKNNFSLTNSYEFDVCIVVRIFFLTIKTFCLIIFRFLKKCLLCRGLPFESLLRYLREASF